jgi:polar amino acid transport system substrate-binding protein
MNIPIKRSGQWLLLLLAVAIVGCSDTSSGEARAGGTLLDEITKRGVLRAGIRFDNPPHSFIAEDGTWVGFDVDISEALADELGVRLEKVKVDELTRISFLKNGKIDVAAASMSHTIERENEVDFSQTYFWSKQTFLVRKGEIASLDDLVGKTVGMDRGSHAIGNWRDWLETNGHLDGIGVRENDSELRDAINYALQRIASSGRYAEIYDRWFGPEAETPVPLQGEIEVWPQG